MPSVSAWMTSADPGSVPKSVEHIRAEKTWNKINDNPSSVEFEPLTGPALAAQTVRIDWDNSASLASSEAGKAPTRKGTILGVKGHAAQPDTEIPKGAIFFLAKRKYQVLSIVPNQIGQIEATFEAVGQ